MPNAAPKGEIVEATQEGEVARIVIRFDRLDAAPVAPAGLYVDLRSGDARFELHKLVHRNGLVLAFETYDSTHPLPRVGEVYSYRGWWLPEAMEAALDATASWRLEKYPDNGGHDHCLFTWETIAAHTGHREAYHSRHGWISVEAYNKIIRDDVYRIRE